MIHKLIDVEKKALCLFTELVNKNLIVAGKSEKDLNQEIYTIAEELFCISNTELSNKLKQT